MRRSSAETSLGLLIGSLWTPTRMEFLLAFDRLFQTQSRRNRLRMNFTMRKITSLTGVIMPPDAYDAEATADSRSSHASAREGGVQSLDRALRLLDALA